jgi:hypothetical protein
LFVSIQQPIPTQFRASRTSIASTINARLSFVQDPIEVCVTGLATPSTIDPLLTEQRVPLPVLAWIAWLTNGATTVHQFFPIVEDFIVAILTDQVVVVEAAGQ